MHAGYLADKKQGGRQLAKRLRIKRLHSHLSRTCAQLAFGKVAPGCCKEELAMLPYSFENDFTKLHIGHYTASEQSDTVFATSPYK